MQVHRAAPERLAPQVCYISRVTHAKVLLMPFDYSSRTESAHVLQEAQAHLVFRGSRECQALLNSQGSPEQQVRHLTSWHWNVCRLCLPALKDTSERFSPSHRTQRCRGLCVLTLCSDHVGICDASYALRLSSTAN